VEPANRCVVEDGKEKRDYAPGGCLFLAGREGLN